MEDLIFNKDFDTQEIITELFKQNLSLQAEVKALRILTIDLYCRCVGLSEEKMEEVFTMSADACFRDIIESSDWFSDMWREKINSELCGIPGIKLSGEEPEPLPVLDNSLFTRIKKYFNK